jgi:hypothetical protein
MPKFNVVKRLPTKEKKKINFNVRPKADPIPTDNRAGLELMAKIPYTRGGGIQAHPAQLLDQINLDLFGMRDTDRTARLEENQPSVGGFGKPDEDLGEDDARVGREELSGVSEGGDHYWNYYRKGEVIRPQGNTDISVGDFIHITQNFTQIVKDDKLTIAYGDEDEYEPEINDERYAELGSDDEDNEWTYDKKYDTQRKAEDFPKLLQKMNKEKQRVFRKNPEFAEYFNRVEAEHSKKIKKDWDSDMETLISSPFTLKKEVSQDYNSDEYEDMYFYDEESMDTYFSDWKKSLKELVVHHREKKQYLRPRAESPMEEVD